MLEKAHITKYWEGVIQARQTAMSDIETARALAEEMKCHGCEYCKYLFRHEQVLSKTASDLIILVDTLHEGMREVTTVFPRHYEHGEFVYRGVITHDGLYLPLPKENYREYREEYAQEHGKEQAYKLINVVGVGEKAQIIFGDRKAPPNDAQYRTLKDLMVEAEGKLDFFFVYDPDHPH